jgi:hypothetical protein
MIRWSTVWGNAQNSGNLFRGLVLDQQVQHRTLLGRQRFE